MLINSAPNFNKLSHTQNAPALQGFKLSGTDIYKIKTINLFL